MQDVVVAKCLGVQCTGIATDHWLVPLFVTDPGSSFTTEVLRQLNDWLDMFHKVSLVDRHESCGVEGTNRIILEHTKALVQQCERAVKFWDQPEYLQTVENIINRYSDFETGLSPNELAYGSEQMLHYKLLEAIESVEEKHLLAAVC